MSNCEVAGVKLLIGGSPCTYWSIAQTKNRETEASGTGWELFKNFLTARDKYKPDFFLYENNKSMSAAIRAQITREFGFQPVCINSALVSAQNRQRLYWLGRREPDGTYSRVDVEQPEDRKIFLRDILETGVAWREKGYALKADYQKATGRSFVDRGHYPAPGAAEPIETLEAYAGRVVGRRFNENGVRDDYNESLEHVQRFEVNNDPQKTNCLTSVTKDNMIAFPLAINQTDGGKSRTVDAHMGKLENNLVPRMNDPNPAKQQYDCIAEPVRIGTIESAAKTPNHDSQQYRVYSPEGKSVTLCGAGGGYWSKDRIVCGAIQSRRCASRKRRRRAMWKLRRESAWTCRCREARQGGAEK